MYVAPLPTPHSAAFWLALALVRSDLLELEHFASIQPRYSLLFRKIEREWLPLAEA